MKILLSLAPALALLITAACAPAKPTQDPAAIQASAVAAANTMVALTQAAVPTETPIPPTPQPSPTPLPSPTLLALPTLPLSLASQAAPTLALAPAPGTAGDPCNGPLGPKAAGPTAAVRIQNTTGGSVILSLYLQKTSFGECGYRSFNLAPKGSLLVTDLLQGCYFGGAFVTAPKSQTKAFGNGCINSERGTVSVGNEVISIAPG